MNTEGSVGVELRLVMDQLRKDVKQAADMLKTSLGTGSDAAAASTDKAVKKMGELEQQTRKTTRALKDQKDAMLDTWRKSIPPPNVRFSGGSSGGGGGIGGWSTTAGGGLATSPSGMFGGGVPPIISGGGGSAAGGGFLGGGLLGIFAQVGAALAGLRVAVGLVRYAFDKLLIPIRLVIASAEAARRSYAGSLQQGMPTGFSIQRQMIAGALGVGSGEVMHYAEQVKILTEKMRMSSLVFQQTNAALTYTAWSTEAMKASFSSISTMFSYQVAPAINHVVEVLKSSFDSLARSPALAMVSAIVTALSHHIAMQIGMIDIIFTSWSLITQAMIDGISYFVRQVKNSIARMFGGKIDSSDQFTKTKELWAVLQELIKATFKRPGSQSAPSATGSAHQMAASSWEKMGLILGPSPAMDAARETARNTRKAAWLLEKLLENNGAPRGGYGSNPLASAS